MGRYMGIWGVKSARREECDVEMQEPKSMLEEVTGLKKVEKGLEEVRVDGRMFDHLLEPHPTNGEDLKSVCRPPPDSLLIRSNTYHIWGGVLD